jgi:23S rRNA (pseudouridine1915-N3)-methyltransferase
LSLLAPRIVAVGKFGHGAETDLFRRYAGRLRPPPVLIEIAEASGTAVEIKRREAEALLAAVPAKSLAVALDQGGEVLDTPGFVRLLANAGRPLCFLLGGAEGLDATVLAHADTILSLGRMTWPHLLARIMLAEQLYRAQCIAAGHPYHRAGRP